MYLKIVSLIAAAIMLPTTVQAHGYGYGRSFGHFGNGYASVPVYSYVNPVVATVSVPVALPQVAYPVVTAPVALPAVAVTQTVAYAQQPVVTAAYAAPMPVSACLSAAPTPVVAAPQPVVAAVQPVVAAAVTPVASVYTLATVAVPTYTPPVFAVAAPTYSYGFGSSYNVGVGYGGFGSFASYGTAGVRFGHAGHFGHSSHSSHFGQQRSNVRITVNSNNVKGNNNGHRR